MFNEFQWTRFGCLSTNGFRGDVAVHATHLCHPVRPFALSLSLSFLSLHRKLFITLSGLIRYKEKHSQPKKENKTQTTVAPTTLLPSHHIISPRIASHRHRFHFILVIFIATWTWAKTALTICWCVHFNTSCVGCCSFLLYTLSVCAAWFGAARIFFPRISAHKNAHAATIFANTLTSERERERERKGDRHHLWCATPFLYTLINKQFWIVKTYLLHKCTQRWVNNNNLMTSTVNGKHQRPNKQQTKLVHNSCIF